jgi:Ni/Fe-hydrogenase subunit HybB-like protein
MRAAPTSDKTGTALINHWQGGVPVNQGIVFSPFMLFLVGLAAIGLGLAALRFISPLGRFSAMNDLYAWGIWKTFNVMTLTALGSGPLALGMAAWVFNRRKLHAVMRTALISGFLLYATGLIALGFDVGRPWNFYNAFLPWRWNAESAMLEISICMPVYCALFLTFEILPVILERTYYTGNEKTRSLLRRAAPGIRKAYPFAIIGAYVVPLMHQSSLGGLLLLAGTKIDSLWQSPAMPLLYLIAAGLCGFAFTIFLLLIACLLYSRPLSSEILAELANLLSVICFLFLAIRLTDLLWRRQLPAAFALDGMSLMFLGETSLILIPALMLRIKRIRETPRWLLNMSALACLGGMSYRFIPTSIAYRPPHSTGYFPSVPELFIAVGYIALGGAAFVLSINYFAILPGETDSWDHSFRPFFRKRRAIEAPPTVPKVVLEGGI